MQVVAEPFPEYCDILLQQNGDCDNVYLTARVNNILRDIDMTLSDTNELQVQLSTLTSLLVSVAGTPLQDKVQLPYIRCKNRIKRLLLEEEDRVKKQEQKQIEKRNMSRELAIDKLENIAFNKS